MELSIIVPVYNMAADDKLVWCLNSLVGQTVSDYEIIAVDDCSTDHSSGNMKKTIRTVSVSLLLPKIKSRGELKIWGLHGRKVSGSVLLTVMIG